MNADVLSKIIPHSKKKIIKCLDFYNMVSDDHIIILLYSYYHKVNGINMDRFISLIECLMNLGREDILYDFLDVTASTRVLRSVYRVRDSKMIFGYLLKGYTVEYGKDLRTKLEEERMMEVEKEVYSRGVYSLRDEEEEEEIEEELRCKFEVMNIEEMAEIIEKETFSKRG